MTNRQIILCVVAGILILFGIGIGTAVVNMHRTSGSAPVSSKKPASPTVEEIRMDEFTNPVSKPKGDFVKRVGGPHTSMIDGVQVPGSRYVVHGKTRGYVSTHHTKQAAFRSLA